MSDNHRVLLVDDDPEVLATYREVLTSRPRRHRRRGASRALTLELFPVTSGEDAIALVRSERDAGRRFACGVFDMRMPGIDGVETIREIRKIDRALLCAVCTAYTDRTIDEIDGLFWPSEKDQWDYLQKPIAPAELLQKIRCLVSSWNRRRREERRQTRMASLIEQLSKLASAKPGNVDSSLDLLIAAVHDLTQTSHGALLEEGPQGIRVVRSWSDADDDSWAERLSKLRLDDPAGDDDLVFFSVPSEGISRTLALTSDAEADRELLGSLGLLLDNAARLISLNSELQLTNDSLTRSCEALASAKEQAVQSAKLAAIGQVAASVAHEVNTPLSVIQLESELMLDAVTSKTFDPSVIETGSLQIQQEVQRMKKVVGQIKDFARKPPDRLEAVDVNDAINAALGALKHRLAREPIAVTVTVADDLPSVRGDRTQLTQVIVNLLANAFDAMGSQPSQPVAVNASACADNPGTVHIEVSDTGCGMDETTVAQALEPFFTTKSPGQGTGLGLAVVKTIVDLYDGKLQIASKPQWGTTVRVTMPAYSPRHSPEPPSTPPRALVVRADEDSAASTADAVRRAGSEPIVVQSFAEASASVERGDVDIVIAELKAGGSTVWNLLDDLEHAESPNIPVLVIGRGHRTGRTDELEQLGISGQISEPIDPTSLRDLIAIALDKQQAERVA